MGLRTVLTVSVLVGGLTAPPSIGAQVQESAKTRHDLGSEVLTDTSLFAPDLIARVRKMLADGHTGTQYIELSGRPNLPLVIARYGKPSKVVQEEWSTGFAPGRGFFNESWTANYYGRFVLLVRPDDPKQGIEYVAVTSPSK